MDNIISSMSECSASEVGVDEDEHELRYVFSSDRYSIFGVPRRGGIVHSGMLERMLSMVLPYYDMTRCVPG